MAKKEETAFPHYEEPGISARDLFAAAALIGLIASRTLKHTEDDLAHDAYVIADAMLKARAKQGSE